MKRILLVALAIASAGYVVGQAVEPATHNKNQPVLTGGEFVTVGKHTEVFGGSISLAFPNLPAGHYTIKIDAAENYFAAAGKRVMTVRCGRTVLADNVDLFRATGGHGKNCTIAGEVDHKADNLEGPLTVTFSSSVKNAKFDAVHILNAAGKVAVETTAAALEAQFDGLDAPFGQIPRVTAAEIWKDASKTSGRAHGRSGAAHVHERKDRADPNGRPGDPAPWHSRLRLVERVLARGGAGRYGHRLSAGHRRCRLVGPGTMAAGGHRHER